MVLKGLKVLTGRVSDLCLSGHELPLVQNIRANGSCRVSKQCIWPLGSHPSSLLHMEQHCLPSEFNDSRHLILDNPPCSFAIQAAKGGKTDTLGKTLASKKKKKKNASPCLLPCSATAPWPLSASSTVVAQPACASEDRHDKKGNMACVVDIQGWNEFCQSKFVFAIQEPVCRWQGHLYLREKPLKAESGNKASQQPTFLWKPVRRMLNSSFVLVKYYIMNDFLQFQSSLNVNFKTRSVRSECINGNAPQVVRL